jgi:hypothetical protein
MFGSLHTNQTCKFIFLQVGLDLSRNRYMINRRNLRDGYTSYAGSHILIYLINGLYRAEAYSADDSRSAGQDSRCSVLKISAWTLRTTQLRWSSGSHTGLCFPSSRVQTRPKPLDFFCVKNPQQAFLRRGS